MSSGRQDNSGGELRQVGRYEILSKIGAGAAGTVYRATDPTIRRTVALKLIPVDLTLSGEASDRDSPGERLFRREAEAAGSLAHPHIVTLYDAGREGDFFFLAMEFIEGETLDAEIRRDAPLPVHRIVEIGASVSEALAFAHARGVIHRDVKPANLLVLRDGTVKVSDFGIARLLEGGATLATRTGFVGTPAYASPEALLGEEVDARTDLFAVGVILYEAATGRHPFRKEHIPATLNAILTTDPPAPSALEPGVPEALSAVIMKAIARERADRYASGAELAQALRRAVASPEALTGAGPSPRPSSRRRGLSRVVAATAGLAAAVAVALFAVGPDRISQLLRRERPSSEETIAPPAAVSAEPVSLGVMPFEAVRAAEGDAWLAGALREGINTELSRLSKVKVYSKQFLDFLTTRKKLTDYEAATELGIRKMIAGNFMAQGGRIQVETVVVDVQTGVLETSVQAEGTVEEFFDLKRRIVLAIVDRLALPITVDERNGMIARAPASVDPLRELLEAEGATGSARAPSGSPRSSLRDLLPDWTASAHAEDGSAEVEPFLEAYRSATETKSLDRLADLYLHYTPDQREAQARYFQRAEDLRVALADVEAVVLGDEAVVSFTRADEFLDTDTGKRVELEVRLTKTLRRQGGEWKIEE